MGKQGRKKTELYEKELPRAIIKELMKEKLTFVELSKILKRDKNIINIYKHKLLIEKFILRNGNKGKYKYSVNWDKFFSLFQDYINEKGKLAEKNLKQKLSKMQLNLDRANTKHIKELLQEKLKNCSLEPTLNFCFKGFVYELLDNDYKLSNEELRAFEYFRLCIYWANE